ncbi:hypothetical protein H9P43_008936 [Blastocladiella emersonii ATCC 22665]|nr:hypothetical protein H9P43_008936 [Blastocladiella emersonii ATCC 22665]
MEDLFSKLAIHAVTVAGKAAFGMAVSKAVKQLTDYATGDEGGAKGKKASAAKAVAPAAAAQPDDDAAVLDDLRAKLQQKVAILTPSIDLIQVVSAKSNNQGLHAVLSMADDLNAEIDELLATLNDTASPPAAATVSARVRRILAKIEDAVPYINLALAVSGVRLGGEGGLSMHTLLNASRAVLSAGDGDAFMGTAFPCRVYRLFEASVRAEGLPNWTWKLEHLQSSAAVWRGAGKAGGDRVVVREMSPMPGEAPQVLDFDVASLKAMFFTATGRLLNIPNSEPGRPVLVLHMDEYVAIEVLAPEDDDDDSDLDDDDSDDGGDSDGEKSKPKSSRPKAKDAVVAPPADPKRPWVAAPMPTTSSTSLALLESILRLAALENTLGGVSHLDVPDDELWAHLSNNQTQGIGSMVPLASSGRATPASGRRK